MSTLSHHQLLLNKAVSNKGFDPAFQTNFTYSQTNVLNDTAISTINAWNTGRSLTSHADGTGKWAAEIVYDAAGISPILGILDDAATGNGAYISTGVAANGGGIQTSASFYAGGNFIIANTSGGAALSVGDAFLLLVDTTARKMWVKASNGGYFGLGDPTTGTLPTFTWNTALTLRIAGSLLGTVTKVHINTGTLVVNSPVAGFSSWG